uniref:Uncharacterized protein n=1 Tax=Nothobranchius kadleci TaxID=1051664 RepID=A0A1A8C7Y9_NOTKA
MIPRPALSSGITAHRLYKNITLYMNEPKPPVAGRSGLTSWDHKPLTLMLPWLGSRPQAVAKYCDIYFRSGFDVLVVESEVKDFLWPRWGLDHGKTLLDLLQSERFTTRPLLVHAFSIGGYTFAQLLVHISKDEHKYEAVTKRIKGQVYDSLVVGTLDHMAVGLSKTMFPRWETLVKEISLLYFNIFKRQTVDYFNASIDVFWNTPVTAPALFYFCENDLMSDAQTVERLSGYWQKNGIEITTKKWKVSKHAGHLKMHPEEYLSTFNSFLQSLQLVPLKAKM